MITMMDLPVSIVEQIPDKFQEEKSDVSPLHGVFAYFGQQVFYVVYLAAWTDVRTLN
jgi:hypothetical protein